MNQIYGEVLCEERQDYKPSRSSRIMYEWIITPISIGTVALIEVLSMIICICICLCDFESSYQAEMHDWISSISINLGYSEAQFWKTELVVLIMIGFVLSIIALFSKYLAQKLFKKCSFAEIAKYLTKYIPDKPRDMGWNVVAGSVCYLVGVVLAYGLISIFFLPYEVISFSRDLRLAQDTRILIMLFSVFFVVFNTFTGFDNVFGTILNGTYYESPAANNWSRASVTWQFINHYLPWVVAVIGCALAIRVPL